MIVFSIPPWQKHSGDGADPKHLAAEIKQGDDIIEGHLTVFKSQTFQSEIQIIANCN